MTEPWALGATAGLLLILTLDHHTPRWMAIPLYLGAALLLGLAVRGCR